MTASDTRRNLPSAAELRDLRFEIEEFNTEYAHGQDAGHGGAAVEVMRHVLDEGDLYDWPGFFTDDGFYRITGRENADEGLPIGLIYCDGKGMLIDRTRAIVKTTMHAPRYLRHYTSNVQVLGVGAAGDIEARSNYLVVETLMEDKTRIFQGGRYDDVFVRMDGALKHPQRVGISSLIPYSAASRATMRWARAPTTRRRYQGAMVVVFMGLACLRTFSRISSSRSPSTALPRYASHPLTSCGYGLTAVRAMDSVSSLPPFIVRATAAPARGKSIDPRTLDFT